MMWNWFRNQKVSNSIEFDRSKFLIIPDDAEVLHDRPYDLVFLSHGHTASHWIAAALNSHSDVLCTLSVFAVPTFENTIGDPEKEPRRLEFQSIVQQSEPMAPDPYFEILRRYEEGKTLYANIHKYTATSFSQFKNQTRFAKPYFVADLVRNPIARVESNARFLSAILSDQNHRIHDMHWAQSMEFFRNPSVRDLFGPVLRKYRVSRRDPRSAAFCRSVWTVFVEFGERTLPFQRIRMEDLTGSKDTFADFLYAASAGKIEADQQ